MKSILIVSTLLLTASSFAGAAATPRWISSTQAEPWKESPVTVAASSGTNTLKLDTKTTFQTMDGFGGCFNDLGWQALLALNEQKREAALKSLFDPSEANFTLCRAPIGANDFSLSAYFLSEEPDDYEMKHFSIERDKHDLIPFMKAAMKYQPKLGVWGVPWSPPAWMKTNNHYAKGKIKQDAQTLSAYALYFSKYVQAYRAEGINVYAVMPQNEPTYNDNIYPQCKWTGAELNVFMRDYLVPRLKADKVDVEVWLGTLVSNKMAEYTDPVMDDPVTNAAITGVGYQWGGQNLLQATHDKYPGKKLSQTETECNNGANTWEQGMGTFRKIIEDTNHFASSYFFWNLILNEGGLSSWNWHQNSLITINRNVNSIKYNPEFYAMKHFSAAVQPGAKRIAVSGGPFKNVVGFLNPSGSKVVIFQNDANFPVSAEIEIGDYSVEVEAPAKSMNTVTLPSKVSSADLVPKVIKLPAEKAEVTGQGIQQEGPNGARNISSWNDTTSYFTWSQVTVPAGHYQVELLYSNQNGSGNKIAVTVNGKTLESVTMPITSSWDEFVGVKMGEVEVGQAGKVDLTVKAVEKIGGWIGNVKAVRLYRLELNPR
jgi:glucosylceramidase